jgi:imidazolonepropionase
MPNILFRHIKGLVLANHEFSRLEGAAMHNIPIIENAYLLIENERIIDFGDMQFCPERADQIIDCKGRFILPAWCDSHTHLVFAGSRETEFLDKIKGLSYAEIAAKGGGILNSARLLQQTPEEELLAQSLPRLHEISQNGTGAVEIKSGYGLTLEAELKMLRVIRELKKHTLMPIKATFLAAHALPLEYKDNKRGYLDLVINKMLPAVADENLADFIDVFCETGFFSPQDTEEICQAAARYDLIPKIHANQLGFSGGVQIGVLNKALSVDHLEHADDAEIQALLGSPTIGTLLPSAAFFLRMPYPKARKMIDSGLGVALATDFNPGSSPSGKMSFVLTLACLYMGMSPQEAISAATINGAYAMNLEQEVGSICRGKLANLIITQPINSLAFIPYYFGGDVVESVWIKGQKIK